MKRIIPILLALVLLIGAIPLIASAHSGNEVTVTWDGPMAKDPTDY